MRYGSVTDAFKALKPHNILPTAGALLLGLKSSSSWGYRLHDFDWFRTVTNWVQSPDCYQYTSFWSVVEEEFKTSTKIVGSQGKAWKIQPRSCQTDLFFLDNLDSDKLKVQEPQLGCYAHEGDREARRMLCWAWSAYTIWATRQCSRI